MSVKFRSRRFVCQKMLPSRCLHIIYEGYYSQLVGRQPGGQIPSWPRFNRKMSIKMVHTFTRLYVLMLELCRQNWSNHRFQLLKVKVSLTAWSLV